MKIGIIREGKIPVDKRVALTPNQCREMREKYPSTSFFVQKSPYRCFKDSEYEAAGCQIAEDLSHCDILLGIKEVPVDDLIPRKTYLFFSHTIKKQAYNRNLLIALLNKKIRMIDYERLTDDQQQRVIAFGHYAGLVGAYNGLRAYGERYQKFDLKPAHKCFDMQEMFHELPKVSLPPIKIAVTGGGRVALGALLVLQKAGIQQVSVEDFLQHTYSHPVFVQLNPEDYNKRADGQSFDMGDFYQHPQKFVSHFRRFTKVADLFIAAAYWDPRAPILFSREDTRETDFRIRIIADITCDINGSVPTTLKPSMIEDPFYDYDPDTDHLVLPFSGKKHITVMAVDNLPNELPRDASEAFGQMLMTHVFPNLLVETGSPMIDRATITKDGKLTNDYLYLQDFVAGKE